MRIPTIALLVIVYSIAGCASYQKSDRDSRQMALVLYQQVLTIKQEHQKKIGAEKRYYIQVIQTLEDSRIRTDDTDFRRSRIIAAQKEASSMMKTPNAVTNATVSESITTKAKELVDTFETGVEQIRKHRQVHEATIKQLNALEAQYNALENTLLGLSVPIDRKEQMKRAAQLIVNASKQYRELQKEDKAEDQPSQ